MQILEAGYAECYKHVVFFIERQSFKESAIARCYKLRSRRPRRSKFQHVVRRFKSGRKMKERNFKPKQNCKREKMKKVVPRLGREAHLQNAVFWFAKYVVLCVF